MRSATEKPVAMPRILLAALLLASVACPGARTAPTRTEPDPVLAARTFHDVVPPRERTTWRLPSAEAAQLLREQRFEDLDALADRWRSEQTRDPDGRWRLRQLYEGISTPKEPAEETWALLFEHLDRWSRERPGSVTAKVALGDAWADYAWFARGAGRASTVEAEGWRLLRERLERARTFAEAAEALEADCPERYGVLHKVMMGLSYPASAYAEMFEDAVRLEPDYDDFYLSRAYSLLPRWGGGPGEWASFAMEVGATDPARYARVVTHIHARESAIVDRGEVAWPLARTGFRELIERYPESRFWPNALVMFAYRFKDAATAAPFLEQIGEEPDLAVWGTDGYFQQARTWFTCCAPSPGPYLAPRVEESS